MLMYSKAKACFKHSNFFKVKDLDIATNRRTVVTSLEEMADTHRHSQSETRSGPGISHQKSNYELFNCNNFNIRY